VNETQLICAQFALERQHALEVARSCAELCERGTRGGTPADAALDTYRQACVDYLVFVLTGFEERDQRLADLLRARDREAPTSRALAEALAGAGRSREALEKLAGACAGAVSWGEFAEYVSSSWGSRRDALDGWLTRYARLSEWRAVSNLDADAILRERALLGRLTSAHPRGAKPARRPTEAAAALKT
jgi:hypothetical protein